MPFAGGRASACGVGILLRFSLQQVHATTPTLLCAGTGTTLCAADMDVVNSTMWARVMIQAGANAFLSASNADGGLNAVKTKIGELWQSFGGSALAISDGCLTCQAHTTVCGFKQTQQCMSACLQGGGCDNACTVCQTKYCSVAHACGGTFGSEVQYPSVCGDAANAANTMGLDLSILSTAGSEVVCYPSGTIWPAEDASSTSSPTTQGTSATPSITNGAPVNKVSCVVATLVLVALVGHLMPKSDTVGAEM